MNSKCKGCGSKLKKVLWDSRHKVFFVLVCNNPACDMYKQFQGKEGKQPEGITIRLI